MNYITLEEALEQVGWDLQIDARSVYQACEQIEDGRHKRGVRYGVALILTLIVLGKLAGMTSLAGIAQWVRLRAGWLSKVLPHSRASFPCAATYSNVLRTVDAKPGDSGSQRPAHPSGSRETLWSGARSGARATGTAHA